MTPETKEQALPNFDALWNYDQPADTEKAFRDLLPRAIASGDRHYHVELLTQIARAQGLQREFEAAHATLDEAERLLDGVAGTREAGGRARVRYLLERGRVYNSSKEPERARPLFLEAWELAQAAGEDGFAVDAAHMVAIVASPEEAMDWNLKGLELAERSPQPRAQRWRGSLYNNIGWTYHDMGQYPEALAIFEKALAWRQQAGQEKETRIARWCVARTLRSLGRLEEALALQQALDQEYQALAEPNGYVYEELAECLLALNLPSDAQPYFTLAYEQLSQDPWLAANEPDRLARLRETGEGS